MGAIAKNLATWPGQISLREVRASRIPGVKGNGGVDLDTGLLIGGGTPTPVGALINAAVAAVGPGCTLILDDSYLFEVPLVTPSHDFTAKGQGEGTGYYIRSGSNCNGVQNFPHTDLASYQVWNPGGAQAVTGRNITLSDFRINGNRGTYPSGNAGASGNTDGTIDGTTAPGAVYGPSAKGPYSAGYWLSGIVLRGVDNLKIQGMWVYDAPAYHINLYACTNVRLVDNRVEAAVANEGNQDGIHINGGCSDVKGWGNWIQSGDDAIAINLDEGEGGFATDPLAGADISFDETTVHNCITVGRIYGQGARSRRVAIRNTHGYVQWYGLLIGNSAAGPNPDNNHSILLDGWDVRVTGSVNGGALVWIVANCGLVELSRIKHVEPVNGAPVILMSSGTVSSMRVAGYECLRNASGSSAGPLLTMTGGTIGNLALDGVSVVDNGSIPAIPHLLSVTSPATITRLHEGDVDLNHYGDLVDHPGQVGSIVSLGGGGGGLLAANNLSDLASVATARGNLGLGSAALQPSSAFQAAGSAPVLDPATLPGMALWIDGSAPAYSNAAGTTLATADGTSILNAPDRSGNAHHLTRPTGLPATLRIENGARVIEFFNGGYLNLDVASGTVSGMALHALFRPILPIPYGNPLMTFGAASTNPIIAPGYSNTGQVEVYPFAPSTGSAPQYASDPNYRYLAIVSDGSGMRTFVDGVEVGPFTSGPPGPEPATSFTRAGYGIGFESSQSVRGNFRLAELCYFEGPQPASLVRRFDAYLRAKWAAILDTADPQVVWIANSLGAALAVHQDHTIPYLVGTTSAKVRRWVTACRSGITTPQMAARVAGDYAGFVVTPSPSVAVVWEGTNDIAINNVSAATAYANLVTLAVALRAAGYTRVVMATMLPRSGVTDSTRTALNALIVGDTTHWDAVADVGGDPTIGPAGTDTNTTYYVDGIHLTNAGNAVAAPIFRAAIDPLLP